MPFRICEKDYEIEKRQKVLFIHNKAHDNYKNNRYRKKKKDQNMNTNNVIWINWYQSPHTTYYIQAVIVQHKYIYIYILV